MSGAGFWLATTIPSTPGGTHYFPSVKKESQRSCEETGNWNAVGVAFGVLMVLEERWVGESS